MDNGALEAARTPQTRQYRMEEVEMAVVTDNVEDADDDEEVVVVVVVVLDAGLGIMGGTTGMTAGVRSEYSRESCSPV